MRSAGGRSFARARRALEVVGGQERARARLARDRRARFWTCCSTTRSGTAAVRCASRVVADGRVARITVADGGAGVPAEDRDRIFERGASQSGGAGIGLHLARALAQADNGGLRALDGAPTRFELRLPRLAE